MFDSIQALYRSRGPTWL